MMLASDTQAAVTFVKLLVGRLGLVPSVNHTQIATRPVALPGCARVWVGRRSGAWRARAAMVGEHRVPKK